VCRGVLLSVRCEPARSEDARVSVLAHRLWLGGGGGGGGGG